QRKDRQYEDHVRDERQEPVRDAAEVARRDADEDGQDRGERPDREGDHEREPGAPDELREDVLPVRGGAEEVVRGRGKRRLEDLRLSVVRGDLSGEDREHYEDEQDESSGDGLAVAADRAPDVVPAPLPDLCGQRRGADGRRRELVARSDHGRAHRRSRVRGSRMTVATSAARIAVSTATTIIRNSPCMRA